MSKAGQEIPVVVFHGTNFDFEAFDSKHLGLSCENPTTGFGHFFSDSKDEAMSWAFRASSWRGLPKNPILVSADIAGLNLAQVSAKKFHYYLQTARGETIHRHRGKWMQAGYEGFRVKLKDVEWFCVFEPAKIMILARERYLEPKVERVSRMLSAPAAEPESDTPAVTEIPGHQTVKLPRIPRFVLDRSASDGPCP